MPEGEKKSPGPGAVFEAVIEKLVPGGDGLARLEGKVAFIPFTLPGERVRVRVTEAKKDFFRAFPIEILEKSPDRATPPCPVFGRCGGCDWQHISPPAQARQKLALAEDALRRIGGIAFPGLAIESGSPWHYRNRVQIHRAPDGTAGFLARASHALVPIRECPVSRPAFAPLFAPIPGRAPAHAQSGRNSPAPANATRNLDGTRRYQAWSHPLPDGGDFLLCAEPGSPASGEKLPSLDGAAGGIAVPLLGKTLRFDLGCFFQSNLEMTARLVPYALEGLAGSLALDLYCGVGLFGAFLADRFERVLAVEENPIALEWAQRNIGATHDFLRGRVEDLLRAERGLLAEARPEAIVVDPPRTGLDAAVADFLVAKRPSRLTYVSCDPVTLARDLKRLLAAGFSLEGLRLFDFFPQTAHVESVAKLAWRGAPA
jgi:23S rRNA (uracil1939-C5)-methyltransferase